MTVLTRYSKSRPKSQLRSLPEAGASLVELALSLSLLAVTLGAFLQIHQLIMDADDAMRYRSILVSIPSPDALTYEYTGRLKVTSTNALEVGLNKIVAQTEVSNSLQAFDVEAELCVYGYEFKPKRTPLGCQPGITDYSDSKGNCTPCSANQFKEDAEAAIDDSCVSPQYVFVAVIYDKSKQTDCKGPYGAYHVIKSSEINF